MRRSIVMLLFVLFLPCACTHVTDYVSIARQKGGLSEAYLIALEGWTRSQTVYSEFETKVKIAATWKSAAFNGAYLEEYARIYNLRQEERKVRENVQADLAGDFTEFFFYAYTPEKSENDFDKQRSIWTVFLKDGKGNRIDPVEIRRIEKVTPLIEVFYPYVHQYYGNCYSLKFQGLRGVGNGDEKGLLPVTLVFTGVVGRVELKWGS